MLCVLASALPLPRRTHLNQGQGPTSPYEHLALSEKKVEAIPLPHDHVSVMLMLMLMLILAASLRLCSTTGQTRRDRLGDSLDDRATVSSTSPLSSYYIAHTYNPAGLATHAVFQQTVHVSMYLGDSSRWLFHSSLVQ